MLLSCSLLVIIVGTLGACGRGEQMGLSSQHSTHNREKRETKDRQKENESHDTEKNKGIRETCSIFGAHTGEHCELRWTFEIYSNKQKVLVIFFLSSDILNVFSTRLKAMSLCTQQAHKCASRFCLSKPSVCRGLQPRWWWWGQGAQGERLLMFMVKL